jgi:hypothetical protein
MTSKELAAKMARIGNVAEVNKLMKTISALDNAGRVVLLRAISEQMTDAKKQQFLMLLKSEATKADAEVRNWLVQGISKTYVGGMNLTQQQIASIKMPMKAGLPSLAPLTVTALNTNPFMKPHLQAVNALLSDAYLDFGNSMSGYVRGAEKILNETLKKQLRSEIAMGRLEGQAVKEIKKTVKDELASRGFTVLIDRGGNSWSLPRYSEMLTRTHLLKANNEGVINRASDFEVDIVEVSDIGSDCDICSEQEGEIYSISGKSNEYPAIGGNEPPYHPNCRHTLLLRPDLSEN